MRTNLYIKFILTAIAISLAVLAGEKLTSTVHANPGVQAWEYRTATIRYTWGPDAKINGAECLSDDSSAVCQGLIPQIGGDGWEVVSVVSESLRTGPGWAGVTTQKQWIFKRPRNH